MTDDDDTLQAFSLPSEDRHPATIAARLMRLPEHVMLADNEVSFGYLMREVTKEKGGKTELGSVHQVKYMAQGQFKGLFFQLLEGILGHLPDFIIVLDAEYWGKASDIEAEALLYHELSHVKQALDRYGAPRFDRDGNPVFHIVEHDITAFNDEVRRYGAWHEGISGFLKAAAK